MWIFIGMVEGYMFGVRNGGLFVLSFNFLVVLLCVDVWGSWVVRGFIGWGKVLEEMIVY